MAANCYTTTEAIQVADIVTEATIQADGSHNDGSPNGPSPVAWFVEGGQVWNSRSRQNAPAFAGAIRSLRCADATEATSHDESAHSATRTEHVSLTVPDYSMHDAPSVEVSYAIRMFMPPSRYAPGASGLRRVSLRGVGRRRHLLCLALLRGCEIRGSIERDTLLLRLPCGRDECDLSIGEIPARTLHVTREVAPKERPNERLADTLAIRCTSQLLRECVRRHDVCHIEITSLPRERIVTEHRTRYGRMTLRVMPTGGWLVSVSNAHLHNVIKHDTRHECKGTRDVIPANSDIRCYASGRHTMRNVVMLDNTIRCMHHAHNVTRVVTSGNAPPTPVRGRVVILDKNPPVVPSSVPNQNLRIRVSSTVVLT